MKTNIVVCLVAVAFGLAFVRGQEDVCHLPVVRGPCRAVILRWFFNSTTGNCERFMYGGCRGNANNFESQEECRLSCKNAHSTQQMVETSFDESCKPAAEPGVCDAYMPRWFFNVDTGACERFIYGGCGGNLNNYLSSAECERTCLRRAETLDSAYRSGCSTCGWTPHWYPFPARSMQQVVEASFEESCKPAAEPGVCDAYMPRWFFNVHTGACERFIYGGCGGNANNYHSFAECERTCLRRVVTPRRSPQMAGVDFEVGCKPEADSGVCDAHIRRWFFNVKTGQCETFVYGGCGGNENNYKSRKNCEIACLRG
ncbi:carboxypeptidase inhibitor SmCI [Ixodes scapularis]|uniref:carboxypeptidase inhibitor SmCI n=1 Tax=Ixodes scapularis TaxID=6945 RepID=UPI001A9D1360|nr:carboxypeptidase inhibitor SmCI [Ixodes scapularis]